MRLSDLLGKVVVDEDDRRLGVVHDVAALPDGPSVGDFGKALRIEALLVGVHGVWSRLGIPQAHLWRRSREEIAWERVVRVDDERIVVRATDAR